MHCKPRAARTVVPRGATRTSARTADRASSLLRWQRQRQPATTRSLCAVHGHAQLAALRMRMEGASPVPQAPPATAPWQRSVRCVASGATHPLAPRRARTVVRARWTTTCWAQLSVRHALQVLTQPLSATATESARPARMVAQAAQNAMRVAWVRSTMTAAPQLRASTVLRASTHWPQTTVEACARLARTQVRDQPMRPAASSVLLGGLTTTAAPRPRAHCARLETSRQDHCHASAAHLIPTPR